MAWFTMPNRRFLTKRINNAKYLNINTFHWLNEKYFVHNNITSMRLRHFFLIGFILIVLYFQLFPAPDVELFDIPTENFENSNSSTNKTSENACTSCDLQQNENKNSVCTGTNGSSGPSGSSGCQSNKKLLPVLDPMYNMREICKQCILLEDHLFQKQKRCQDCIMKHQLTIEALAEEAVTLDKERKYPEIHNLPEKIRTIEKEFQIKKNPFLTGQAIRKLRKHLMPKCMNHF